MTHKMITVKALRNRYARELWKSRIMRRSLTITEYKMFRFGIESGVWAAQQWINQAVAL